MEKKIKEMALAICKNVMPSGNCHKDNMPCDLECVYGVCAQRLYNKDYRKQSDVAREIFAEIGKILTAKYNSIQAGCHHRMRFGNADTPQGMKELGELSGVRQVIAEIKDFEKKYLEDNNDS